MRLIKCIALFLLAFIPFFTLGAISAPLFKSSSHSLQDQTIFTNDSKNMTQTTILLYKEKLPSEENIIPETIDILIITSTDKTKLSIIHLFPTSNKNSDILLLSELSDYLKNRSKADLITFFIQRESISLNGIVIYNELFEKSITEWMSITAGLQTTQIPSISLVDLFCQQSNGQLLDSLREINYNSLQPRHLSIVLDAFTRFHLNILLDSQSNTISCASIN